MTIQQLQRVFNSELSHLYPQTEVDSFYFLMMESFFQLKRVDLALQSQQEIEIPKAFHEALNKLTLQIPIQYILGKTNFYGLDFFLNNNVLIPRPETEELVDWIINDIKNKNYSVIDIGTGSGCIAISVSKHSNANVTALDVSKEALEIAKKNALSNNTQIHFIEDDILKPLKDYPKYNVIVSNPPYVRHLEKKEIEANVLENEPHLALFVEDENPLIFYDAIANFALKNLSEEGLLYFEINQYLGKETVDLLKSKGFRKIELKKDIFGNDRMIKAQI